MATATLESAIPSHLARERTQPAQLPANYDPPFPAFTARFPTEVKDIVMVTLGAQYPSSDSTDSQAGLKKLIGFFSRGPEKYHPTYYEPASVTDNARFYNEVVIAYWHSTSLHRSWASQSGFEDWWNSLDAEQEQHGWFMEIFLPSIDRFETLFSTDTATEGAAYMRAGVSGPISEHVYWGSMRDRLPVSQIDALEGTDEGQGSKHDPGISAGTPVKKRVRVSGKRNLAVIRSGQDWSDTTPHERTKYLETMHPVLIAGMDFLRDHGEDVGCFSCRFMDVLDRSTLRKEGVDKTFGFAFFDSLESLEGWSKRHQTHLDIFGRFLEYARELQREVEARMSLRLFHEVLVLEPGQQEFEYVGCHGRTGMLAAT